MTQACVSSVEPAVSDVGPSLAVAALATPNGFGNLHAVSEDFRRLLLATGIEIIYKPPK